MTAGELINWINCWRKPRDGWAYPNRMLYALADALCDFELDDLSPGVLTALASPISEMPPPAGAWEALRGRSRNATDAVIDGLRSGAIQAMTDYDNSELRFYQMGILKRSVQ